jgi:hypothetical protein
MINSSPLIETRLSIREEEKYSTRIFVFFKSGEEEKINTSDAAYLNVQREKGACIIYVTPNDFEKDTLKSDPGIQKKYEKFRSIDNRAKVKLFGHGSQNGNIIYSNDGHHPYSIAQVVSIFELIQNPLVRVSLEQFKEFKSLPEQHLRISVLTCFAERFASRFASALKKLTTEEKRWVLSITAGKKNKLMYMQYPYCSNKGGKTYIGEIFSTGHKVIACFLGCAGVALGLSASFADVSDETANLLEYAATAASGLLLLGTLTTILLLNRSTSNSKHKIVIHTNCESDSSKFYYSMYSKDTFKKKLQQAAKGIYSESKKTPYTPTWGA